MRARRVLAVVACVLVFCAWTGLAQERSFVSEPTPAETALFKPYLEWGLRDASHAGNPFDVEAHATFTHTESGQSRTTPMFYVGDDLWKFRFTGTRTGTWEFHTTSESSDLDGHSGTVTVEAGGDPSTVGFLEARGNRFAIPTAGAMRAADTLYNVYINPNRRQTVDEYSSEPSEMQRQIDEMLDELETTGLDALFIAVNNNWFHYGASGHDEHESTSPDARSFEILETLIVRAHERGRHVHIWAWGDEARKQTPIGVGGINGPADRRLQRYIAARLGPLPGWTMSYGFDLEEWVTPEQVRSWHAYLQDQLGWPHLLMARELGQYEDTTFVLGYEKLDVYSTDDRPESAFYSLARERLENEANAPVLFERRFLHLRDDVWDMATTRRALWQFTMAGGAGAIWGPLWEGGPPYPSPGQLRVHARFWETRFDAGLSPLGDAEGGSLLTLGSDSHRVFYAEDASALMLDLTGMDSALPAVAVDTKSDVYREIDVGNMGPGEAMWTAPYESDWAVSVGTF